jgi:uncharacterized membrane protein HdeD (DUF308 family)
MLDLLGRNWWVIALRGIIAIAFGVLAFVQPQLTLRLLITLVGAYLVADGLSLLASYVRGDADARRAGRPVGLMGILGIVAGVVAFVWPNITAIALLAVVAVWAILTGVFQIVAAIRLRREIQGELLMAIGGALSVAFGVYLLINPSDGLVSLVSLVGFWAVLFGITQVVLAFRIRAHRSDVADIQGATAAG